MIKAIYFDMDGTIADLYGQYGWKADLEAERTTPYRNAKPLLDMRWLAQHLPSVQFDEIHIEPYGTPKYEVAEVKEAILFDDELQNLLDWGGEPILADRINETLKHLLQNF